MKCKNILGYTFIPLDVNIINDDEDLKDYHELLSLGIKDYAKSHKDKGFVISMNGVFDKDTPTDTIAKQFCKMEIEDSGKYEIPGVYLWYDGDNLIYIGETENVLDRFKNGYGRISPRNVFYGGQSTNCKMNFVANKHNNSLSFYYMKCKKEESKIIEGKLLKHFREENESGKSITMLYNYRGNKKEFRKDILELIGKK